MRPKFHRLDQIWKTGSRPIPPPKAGASRSPSLSSDAVGTPTTARGEMCESFFNRHYTTYHKDASHVEQQKLNMFLTSWAGSTQGIANLSHIANLSNFTNTSNMCTTYYVVCNKRAAAHINHATQQMEMPTQVLCLGHRQGSLVYYLAPQ